MKRFRTGLVAAVALNTAWTMSERASAACQATINGAPMPPDICALATQVYGSVEPGHYWLDAQGNWSRVGVPWPQGNLLRDAQSRGGPSWSHHGEFGDMGSDGSCTYFNDPETGATVMTGDC